MSASNGERPQDHIVASMLLELAVDACERAADAANKVDADTVNWHYVEQQINRAQGKLAAAGVMAAMRAAITTPPEEEAN